LPDRAAPPSGGSKRIAAALALVAAAASSDAATPTGTPATSDHFLHDLVAELRAKLDDIAARTPRQVAPVPVAVTWKPQRVASLELGAPLLAMVGGDHGVLWAVTSKEVIALATAPRVQEIARTAFVGEPAALQPRDPVGAAVVPGQTSAIIASASPWAMGMRVALDHGKLTTSPAGAQFTLCGGTVQTQLAPGRNYFEDPDGGYLDMACAELVDARGAGERATAKLRVAARDKLAVTVSACATDGGCKDIASAQYADVGTAFAITDVERDGTPEVAFASAAAPGDPDVVTVVALGDDLKHAKLHKAFTGGIAAIAVVDADPARARELYVAVRLTGATRVDLWRLD
jgi:hypothetical protein